MKRVLHGGQCNGLFRVGWGFYDNMYVINLLYHLFIQVVPYKERHSIRGKCSPWVPEMVFTIRPQQYFYVLEYQFHILKTLF